MAMNYGDGPTTGDGDMHGVSNATHTPRWCYVTNSVRSFVRVRCGIVTSLQQLATCLHLSIARRRMAKQERDWDQARAGRGVRGEEEEGSCDRQ